MQYVERPIISLDWITLVLVGCIVVLALLKGAYPNRFDSFIKLPFSKNYFISKGRTEEIKHPFNLLLFVIQVLSISLFVYLFFSEESKSNPFLFIQIIIGFVTLVIVKISIEKIIGNIFSIEKIIDQYVLEKLTYRNLLAIILLVFNIIFYFTVNPSSTVLIVITGVFGVLNLIFIYFSLKKHRSLLFGNFFYFLLYLCTLEISPYFILYKALIK